MPAAGGESAAARPQRVEWDDQPAVVGTPDDDLLALDEALHELEQHDPQTAKLVKLRYFSGLSHQQAAEALGITAAVSPTGSGPWPRPGYTSVCNKIEHAGLLFRVP